MKRTNVFWLLAQLALLLTFPSLFFCSRQEPGEGSREMAAPSILAVTDSEPESLSWAADTLLQHVSILLTDPAPDPQIIPLFLYALPIDQLETVGIAAEQFGQLRLDGRPIVDAAGRVIPAPLSFWRNSFAKAFRSLVADGHHTFALEIPIYFNNSGFQPEFLSKWEETRKAQFEAAPETVDLWLTKQLWKRDLLEHIFAITDTIDSTASLWLLTPSAIQLAQHCAVSPGFSALHHRNVKALICSRSFFPDSLITYQGRRISCPVTQAYLDFSWARNAVDLNRQDLLFCPESYFLKGDEADSAFIQNYAINLVCAALQDSARHFLLNHRRALSGIAGDGKLASFLGRIRGVLPSLSSARPETNSRIPRTGVLFSDSYSLLRGGPGLCEMESFYQLALPFLGHGIPLSVVPLERVSDPAYLQQFEVLLASYEAFKPLSPAAHFAIKDWVEDGGILIFYLGRTGSYDELEAWWAKDFDRPHEHLFQLLRTGLYPVSGMHKVEKGIVYVDHTSPAELARKPKSGEMVWNTYITVLTRYANYDSSLFLDQNFLQSRRGPYLLAAMTEDPADPDSAVFHGSFLDLLAPQIAPIRTKILALGKVSLLFDLSRVPSDSLALLHASGALLRKRSSPGALELSLQWFPGVPGEAWLRVPEEPLQVTIVTAAGNSLPFELKRFDQQGLLKISFTFAKEPLQIQVRSEQVSATLALKGDS